MTPNSYTVSGPLTVTLLPNACNDSSYLPPSPLEQLITHPRLETVSIAHDDKHGQYQLSIRFRNGEIKVFKDAYLPLAINNANLWLMI